MKLKLVRFFCAMHNVSSEAPTEVLAEKWEVQLPLSLHLAL